SDLSRGADGGGGGATGGGRQGGVTSSASGCCVPGGSTMGGGPKPCARAVRTARSWRGNLCLYAPRTGGAYDSYHRTAGPAGRPRGRGGGVAACGARAADDGGDWVSQHRRLVRMHSSWPRFARA